MKEHEDEICPNNSSRCHTAIFRETVEAAAVLQNTLGQVVQKTVFGLQVGGVRILRDRFAGWRFTAKCVPCSPEPPIQHPLGESRTRRVQSLLLFPLFFSSGTIGSTKARSRTNGSPRSLFGCDGKCTHRYLTRRGWRAGAVSQF